LAHACDRVLAGPWFPVVRASDCARLRGECEEALARLRAEIEAARISPRWQDAWIDFLSWEGETIMDPDRIDELGLDPRRLAQYWACALAGFARSGYAGALAAPTFDGRLDSDAIDALWSFMGSAVGAVAAPRFEVLKANPYTHALHACALGAHLALHGSGRVAFVVDTDGDAWRVESHIWAGDRLELVEVTERPRARIASAKTTQRLAARLLRALRRLASRM
jgi:hypothetical protein